MSRVLSPERREAAENAIYASRAATAIMSALVDVQEAARRDQGSQAIVKAMVDAMARHDGIFTDPDTVLVAIDAVLAEQVAA